MGTFYGPFGMLYISAHTRTDILFIKVHLLCHCIEFYFMVFPKQRTGMISINTKDTSVFLSLD